MHSLPHPITATEGQGLKVLAVDTRSEEGRAFMRAMLRDSRRRREIGPALIRVQSALGSYRKTQDNQRTGWRGYFATVADARAFVREEIAKARKEMDAFDAREAEREAFRTYALPRAA